MATLAVRPISHRRAPRRPVAASVAILATMALLAAPSAVVATGVPEIVRLHVSKDAQGRAFAPGTELRVMPAEEFDRLEGAARAAEAGRSPNAGPSLLRARHEATWVGDALIGRSELQIGESDDGESHNGENGSHVIVDPWSPALVGLTDPVAPIRVGADGRLAFLLKPDGPRVLSLSWEQKARGGSNGRVFDLALPALATCRLVLNLPEGIVPEVAGMLRFGPEPASPEGRAKWRFEGPGGVARVRLRDASERPDATEGVWVEGLTQVDATVAPARWSVDWTVDSSSTAARRFDFRLDAGLDLIDVTGPAVASYRVDPATEVPSEGTQISVRLDEAGPGTSPIRVRALAKIPPEGAWKVPSARPLDATWTGGRTLVRFGTDRVVSGVEELSGRQTSPRVEEIDEAEGRVDLTLAFDATAPGPVARLTLKPSTPRLSAEVRGWLRLSSLEVPRLEATIAWEADRGRPLSLAVDLPSGWTPEHVQIRDAVDPTSWHAEAKAEGGSRITIRSPLAPDSRASPIVDLVAVATSGERFGPIDLPKVVPVATRITDELWGVQAEPGIAVAPTRARGLSWLDPAALEPASETPPRSEESRPVLAWRWIAADGRGTLRRSRAAASEAARPWVLAEIADGRLRLDYYLVAPNSAVREGEILVGGTLPDSGELRWELVGEPGRAVRATPLIAAEIAALMPPLARSAWRLRWPRMGADRVVLHAREERPWDGRGTLPLLLVPGEPEARGRVLVSLREDIRSSISAPGLMPLEPRWASRFAATALGLPEAGKDEETTRRSRCAYAFRYGPTSPPFALETDTLARTSTGGLVREAILKTRATGPDRAWHRLDLRIVPGTDREIAITLPRGATLQRIEADGRPAAAHRDGDRLVLGWPEPARDHPFAEVAVEYVGTHQGAVPACSMPILRSCRLTETDEGHVLATAGDRPEPALAEDPARRLLPTLPRRSPLAREDEDRGAIRDLGKRIREGPRVVTTLGDWLARLDRGAVPIVLDREEIADAGWGPATRLDVQEFLAASATARDVFNRLGLDLRAVGGVLLVTGRAPDADAEWIDRDALRSAATIGNDPTDRFQSVGRWRGEFTPNPEPSRLSVRPQSYRGANRRHVFSLGAFGSPSYLVRESDGPHAWSILIGAFVTFAILEGASRLVPRIRASVVVAALTIGLGLLVLGPSRWQGVASAILWGSLALSAVAMRGALTERRATRRTSRPSRFARFVPALLVAALLATAGPRPAETSTQAPSPPEGPPILVLLPYDPPFDASRPSDHVVLKVADLERLKALAEMAVPPVPAPNLITALHEARREGTTDVRVASAHDLWTDSAEPTSWSFPIEGARDLNATLDGRDVPIRIDSTGKLGTVSVTGKGFHRLIVRRVAALDRSDGTARLSLPVVAVASARIRVEDDGQGGDVAMPQARGRTSRHDGLAEAPLGPVGSLDLEWSSPLRGPRQPVGLATVLGLWDIEPAGDRLRLRIIATGPSGLSRLSLRLDPGASVRSVQVPAGLVQAHCSDLPTGVACDLALDPALAPGEAITVDVWSSLDEAATDRRRSPGVEILGPTLEDASYGVRRPESWEGRLAPTPELDLVSDDAFARAWGSFPDAARTLAGAARVGTPARMEIATGPPRASPHVRPSVLLEISPGRLDVMADATWTGTPGAREIEIGVPRDLRLTRVECVGLSDWEQVADDRLRLRFDGDLPPGARRIRIVGWTPLEGDPLSPGPSRGELVAPWTTWPGAVTEPGVLTIASPPGVTFRLRPDDGVTRTAPPTVAGARFLAAFALPPGAKPGVLEWAVETGGVTVRVQSLLTLHPEAVEWTATARYRVPWGPCPPIRLRFPTAWADAITAEIPGSKARPIVDRGDESTVWTLQPDPAAWGYVRVILRGSRPRDRSQPLEFPDLVPLGRASVDSVDSFLGYADASGESTIVEGSSQLQAIAGDRWDEDEIPWPLDMPRNVFRVLREGWSLVFRSPSSAASPGAETGSATATLAEYSCVLGAEGNLVGRAIFHLRPSISPFLILRTAPTDNLLGAAIDGRPTRPLRDPAGLVYLPLPDGGASLLSFAWEGKSAANRIPGRDRITVPVIEGQVTPAILRVSAPPSVAMRSDLHAGLGLREGSIMDANLRGLEASALAIQGRLGTLDRGSNEALTALLGDLIDFEIRAREAIRGARLSPSRGAIPAVGSIERIRDQVGETLVAEGLGDYVASARARVGRQGDDPLANRPIPPPPPDPFRVHAIGPSRVFVGEIGGTAETAVISWDGVADPREITHDATTVAVGLILALSTLILARKAPFWGNLAISLSTNLGLLAAGGGWLVPSVYLIVFLIAPGLPVSRVRTMIDPAGRGD